MAAPLLIDLSHTCHTRARTGIQRVVRSMTAALGQRVVGVTFDPYVRDWRTLQPWEHSNLAAIEPAPKRGAHWPWAAKVKGAAQRLIGARPAPLPPNSGLIVPEIFSAAVASALPAVFAATAGSRVAVFHDAIALKVPELTPPKTVARFPAYLRELLSFDGIAAVSDDSRTTLLEYWRWLGVNDVPPVQTIPLGVDRASNLTRHPDRHSETASGVAALPSTNGDVPVVLCVGSIEARKNHLVLLEAAERLWAKGLRFELRLIGMVQAETGRAAFDRLRALQVAGRPLRYDGPASDKVVSTAYAECAFSVYPSFMEGFGLPVLENIAHGKPCVCSARGAVGETARGGGCIALETIEASTLAQAIERLLSNGEALAQLTAEARARKVRTWREYVADLEAWMRTLKRETRKLR